MGEQKPEKTKKHICAGLLAHVDAGKTTLSEGLLYAAGALRTLGRVDTAMPFWTRKRSSARAASPSFPSRQCSTAATRRSRCSTRRATWTFSAEMERTLQVLDYAVLVISGTDGVQAHTETLWRLLTATANRRFCSSTRWTCGRGCAPGGSANALAAAAWIHGADTMAEELAVCDEGLLEQYLETGALDDTIAADCGGKAFPCCFGSALKLEGVDALLQMLWNATREPQYGADFGARVFKISRDAQGNRLTYLKITGGTLSAREQLSGEDGGWQERRPASAFTPVRSSARPSEAGAAWSVP